STLRPCRRSSYLPSGREGPCVEAGGCSCTILEHTDAPEMGGGAVAPVRPRREVEQIRVRAGPPGLEDEVCVDPHAVDERGFLIGDRGAGVVAVDEPDARPHRLG